MALPERATRVAKLASTAFSAKQDLDSFWQDTAELHFPEHADFTDVRDDDDYESNLYDSTPALFRRDFGNWLGSVLRPKGRQWWASRAKDKDVNEDQAVKQWFEDRDEALRDIMYDHKSQFIQAMTLADHQYVAFGNSVTSVEPRKLRNGLLYRTWHPRDCAWLDDDEGEVHVLFRRLKYKLSDLVAKEAQGWTVPQQLKDKLHQEPARNVNCMHIEMPIDYYYLTDKPKNRDKDYVSLYLCSDTNDILYEEERNGFRYSVSRWFRLPNSPYAISPCVSVSQPDARTLQSMTWSIMQAGELAVEPPLIGQSEKVLGPVNLFPGGVTWLDSRYDEKTGAGLRPLDMGKVPELGVQLHGAIRESLGSAWYLNKLFLPDASGEMTAHETERRWQEFLRASQPIVEPAEPERNGRILDLSFQTCLEFNWFKTAENAVEPPEALEGQEVDFTYDNPVEDARKQGVIVSFERAMQITQAAAEADPTVTAHFDNKKAYRETMDAVAPADWVKPEDDPSIQQGEEQISEGLEEQAGIEQADQLAEVAGKVDQVGEAA